MKTGDAFDTVIRAIKAAEAVDYSVLLTEQENRRLVTVFLRDETAQALFDSIQSTLEDERDWRLSLISIEATAPKIEQASSEKSGRSQQAIREEIYTDVERDARFDRDYIVLVVLSTIVAGIGLNSDGIAAVIGAMVIAPILGPILALSLGVSLGDQKLLARSAKTLLAGISIALVVAILLAMVIPINLESHELISRAEVRLDGVALAMAAGGAAALSLTKGQASVLVGVMVAAALLPPAAAFGLFLGAERWEFALRSGLLLALNLASLLVSAQIVFWLKGIRPRTWFEQKDANRAIAINVVLSTLLLIIAVTLIIFLDLDSKITIG